MSRRGRWTGPQDVRNTVAGEWSSGRLLAARVPPCHFPDGLDAPPTTQFPLRVPLRGPTAGELGSRFDDVREWVAAHESARDYRVDTQPRSTRSLGRQSLPVAAFIDSDQAALSMLGRRRDAARFDGLVAQTPQQFRWFAAHQPLTVLDIGQEWPAVLAVARWLRCQDRPDVYVRQVDLPGVHTKLIERHRRTIAALVDDGRTTRRLGSLRAFEEAYGFRSRPLRIRFRALDLACAPVAGLVDVTLPVEELAGLTPSVRRVVVVENEISMLTFPEVIEGLVIWGAGNQAPELLAAIPWLREVDLHYWGDVDTHGFAILDRLRAVLPHVRSLLMDRATLLDHEERWSRENEQTRRDLAHLTDDEAEVYGGLCAGTWGEQVRLEQELIRYSAVEQAAAANVGRPVSAQHAVDWRSRSSRTG